MIQVNVNYHAALAALATINPSAFKSKLQGAVRTALFAAETLATSKLNARYTRPDFATNKMKLEVSGLRGTLSVKDPRHSLARFHVKPSTRPPHNPPGGIAVQVRRGQVEHFPKAFIGKGQVFERVSKPRLPIRRLTGPSGAQMFGSKHIAPLVEQRIANKIQAALGGLL